MTSRGHTLGRSGRIVAAAVVCALAGAGCTRSHPVVAPTTVALDLPPPPQRVISTPPEPVAPTEATTVERPAPANRPARPRPSNARVDAKTPEPAATDVPAESTAPAPEPATPSTPLLRTPQTADEQQAVRRTRDVMQRARTMLDGVNVSTLAQPARQQLDTARRFLEQANQALLDRNHVLASYLADKAETLAKGLSR